jgi:hypothetical protein
MTNEQIQFLISIVTLLLTPILSALVVRHQLKQSHYWWVKQQEFLEAKKYSDKKYDTFENAAKTLPKLKALLLDQQVFLFSKNQCDYLLRYCKKPEKLDKEFIQKEYDRYTQLTVEQNRAIRDVSSEAQQIGFIAMKFYSEKVTVLFQALFKKIKESHDQVISLQEIITFLNQKLDDGVDIEIARAELGILFDTKWNNIELLDYVGAVLDTMFLENFPQKTA